METRASYLLIGSFVLIVTAGLLAFVVWIARVDVNREVQDYNIYVEGSVAGLSVGSDVRYRGIKVGTVLDLAVDPQDPARVHVTVEIGKRTPIREGDVATLQPQGITGVSYVNIAGATAKSPLLVAHAGERLPVIPSHSSEFEQLFESAPELISRTMKLVDRLSEVFSDRNRERITMVLADLNTLANSLAQRRASIDRILDNMDRASGDLAGAARSVHQVSGKAGRLMDEAARTLADARGTLQKGNEVMGKDVPALIADLRKTSHAVDKLAGEAQAIMAENREPLHTFSTEGISQFTHFITEARLLVAGLSRLTERLQTEGAGFLLREPGREYQAK